MYEETTESGFEESVAIDDSMEISFEPEEELYKAPPEGTVAKVQVRAMKGEALGEGWRSGVSKYGTWLSIPFEVVEGPYKGTWASLMVTVDRKDPDDPEGKGKGPDRKFRKVFEIATGMDISQGGSVGFAEFKEKLIGGVFEAVLGPEKKNPEYTRVVRINKRVGDREDGATVGGGDPAPQQVEDDPHDEDIPF